MTNQPAPEKCPDRLCQDGYTFKRFRVQKCEWPGHDALPVGPQPAKRIGANQYDTGTTPFPEGSTPEKFSAAKTVPVVPPLPCNCATRQWDQKCPTHGAKMEDERFQALRPIEKSWMYGNLSALRDCLEQAYDAGHTAPKSGVVPQGAEQPLSLEQRIMRAMHITWDEETEFEVPAEPEPQYFSTLAEAVEFWIKLANLPEQAHAAASQAQRNIYKWEEKPEACPECDSRCFVSAGGGAAMNMTCYHCFLAEEAERSERENAELKAKIAESEARNANISALSLERYHQIQDLIRERDQAREALRVYANPENWSKCAIVEGDNHRPHFVGPVTGDGGWIAREAVGEAVSPSEDAPQPSGPPFHHPVDPPGPRAHVPAEHITKDAPAMPQSYWPSDLTICPNCKQDILKVKHLSEGKQLFCPVAEPAAQPAGKEAPKK